MSKTVIAEIESLYDRQGHRRYGLESISQLEHALQTAARAEAESEPAPFIAAALLHDIGQMIAGLGENPAEDGIDNLHEQVGAAWLRARFGEAVCEPVRLHVAAKRYLCATEPAYAASLAPDSVLSLFLQGGPMRDREIAGFLAQPYAQDAVRLRRHDDRAKVPNAQVPPLDHFLACVEALGNERR